jgi:hypothetical protein
MRFFSFDRRLSPPKSTAEESTMSLLGKCGGGQAPWPVRRWRIPSAPYGAVRNPFLTVPMIDNPVRYSYFLLTLFSIGPSARSYSPGSGQEAGLYKSIRGILVFRNCILVESERRPTRTCREVDTSCYFNIRYPIPLCQPEQPHNLFKRPDLADFLAFFGNRHNYIKTD